MLYQTLANLVIFFQLTRQNEQLAVVQARNTNNMTK